MKSKLLLACLFACGFAVVDAEAEVVRWDILKREPYADGKPRGDRGAYERWTGKVHFAIDPANKFNEVIVDLPLAADCGCDSSSCAS